MRVRRSVLSTHACAMRYVHGCTQCIRQAHGHSASAWSGRPLDARERCEFGSGDVAGRGRSGDDGMGKGVPASARALVLAILAGLPLSLSNDGKDVQLLQWLLCLYI